VVPEARHASLAERRELERRYCSWFAVAPSEHGQRIALLDDVLGHAVAHQAEADKADGFWVGRTHSFSLCGLRRIRRRQALRLAQTRDFDLVTLDIELPGTNGFIIYQRLREIPQLKGTPIFFVSDRPTMENIQRAFDLGAADFIEKPFEARDFLSRILSLVEETTTA